MIVALYITYDLIVLNESYCFNYRIKGIFNIFFDY